MVLAQVWWHRLRHSIGTAEPKMADTDTGPYRLRYAVEIFSSVWREIIQPSQLINSLRDEITNHSQLKLPNLHRLLYIGSLMSY